jgi:hypothetical protein
VARGNNHLAFAFAGFFSADFTAFFLVAIGLPP